jgi:cytochrome c oxidase subunit III
VKPARTLDVSDLPDIGFGAQSPVWWGIVIMCVIETAMMAVTIAAYFYLRLNFSQWPPLGTAQPNLGIPTLTLAVLLISAAPMRIADKLSVALNNEGKNDHAMWFWMWVATILGIVALVLRAYEFGALRCRWDDNAYGSIVWFVLGLHTTHILASVVETLVLLVHVHGKPVHPKHRLDVQVDGVYWYFLVSWGVVVYLTLYWSPRWL